MINYTITETSKRIVRAVFQNLKNRTEHKRIFQEALSILEENPNDAILKVKQFPESKAIFNQLMSEFYDWEESFRKVIQETGTRLEIQGFNIVDKLISMQQKVRHNNLHNSYMSLLIGFVKKQLKLDQQFLKKWRDRKLIIKKQKLQTSKMKADSSSQPVSSLPIQKPRSFLPVSYSSFPKQAVIESEIYHKKQNQRIMNEIEVKKREDIRVIERTTKGSSSKFQKVRQVRFYNLLKYLDSRKQFMFSNKQAVTKQIFVHLEKFMKNKISMMIQISKKRSPGYQSADLFSFYSKQNNTFAFNRTATLPQTDTKLLKVRYPSKLQQYLKLRVDEQKYEDLIRTTLKKKCQKDKKVDKIFLQYTLADNEVKETEFEIDQGPKKRTRLVVGPQSIQYVIESDPWFGDLYIMERSYMRCM